MATNDYLRLTASTSIRHAHTEPNR